MLVSTKGRYALRTMIDLALHGSGEPVKIKDIARRQDISGKYLEQIISILSRAGCVRSVRGNSGRLLFDPAGQRVYRRDDPADHRRKSGSGRLSGR